MTFPLSYFYVLENRFFFSRHGAKKIQRSSITVFLFFGQLNGTVTYKPRRLPRHQRAQAHNSTPNSRQKIFM
jgi:hypothetical protein